MIYFLGQKPLLGTAVRRDLPTTGEGLNVFQGVDLA